MIHDKKYQIGHKSTVFRGPYSELSNYKIGLVIIKHGTALKLPIFAGTEKGKQKRLKFNVRKKKPLGHLISADIFFPDHWLKKPLECRTELGRKSTLYRVGNVFWKQPKGNTAEGKKGGKNKKNSLSPAE